MTGFDTYTGTLAVIPDDNVDTDRIIPARYLTRITRSGYGELLFHDVRGPTFPLDLPSAVGTSILLVGTNFGCGSSREHAVWAIQQAGYRAVIARREADSPGYSDIFRQNGANCGLLLAEVTPEVHAELMEAGQGATITVDLPHQLVTSGGKSFPFSINEATKQALVQGLDLIGTTLAYAPQIEAYEQQSDVFVPPLGVL